MGHRILSSLSSRALAAALLAVGFSSPVLADCSPVPECYGDEHPPTLTLTSPVNGATSTAPGNFTVSGSAGDLDGNFSYVEIYVDGVSLGPIYDFTFSKDVIGLTAGTHTITAKAVDETDISKIVTRSVTVYSPVNAAPTVTLSSPASYATFTAPATISLSATAADSNGGTVSKVTFKDGNAVVNVDSVAPFSYSYTGVAAGVHTITAIATDNNGAATTSSPVTVMVNPSGNPAPTVSLSSPANGGSFVYGATITVSATASDSNGIASVTFLANGAPIGTDTTSPYSLIYTPNTGGSFVLAAIATDAGGSSAVSSTRSVTVGAPPPVSETRKYVYDQNHRLCKTINPESGSTVVAYDAASNVLWTADGQPLPDPAQCNNTGTDVPSSARTTREYDELNRVTKVLTPNGDASVLTEYELDGAVKRLTASNSDGVSVVTDYFYNHRRLLTQEVQSNGLYTIDYGYDANAHLRSTGYPDNEIVDYAPDALGRPTQVVGTSATYATGVHYFPNGAMSDFRYGAVGAGGPLHAMVQNTRQLAMQSRDYKGTTKILDDTYAYDANGNVVSISDAAQSGTASQSRGMAYDGLDRLVSAFGPWGNASYVYDALDNLKRADQGSRQFRYVYDRSTWRLSAINSPAGAQLYSFTYDDNGNIKSKNSQAFIFDAANRMAWAGTISGAAGLQLYRYDGLGRRVLTTDPSPADPENPPKTYYVYTQAGQIIYASEARTSLNRSYIYLNGSQVATRTKAFGTGTPTVRFQMTDALGSPAVNTNTTGAATSIQRTSFTPWGEASPSVDGTGYTGHVMDVGTGLTYMQQRYYDPQIGRFLSVDPVAARTGGDNFNRYWYANNNPYRFTDPDGRETGMFQKDEYRLPQPDPAAVETTIGLIVDFTPGIGDAKGVYDAYQEPTASNVIAAGIGFFPLVGDVASKAIKEGNHVADAIKAVDKLPKPPTGPGKVPVGERDAKRFFTPSEREAKRAEQEHQCANGCGTAIDETNSAGHHVERHADGGQTVTENHAEVCIPCHKDLHSGGDQ